MATWPTVQGAKHSLPVLMAPLTQRSNQTNMAFKFYKQKNQVPSCKFVNKSHGLYLEMCTSLYFASSGFSEYFLTPSASHFFAKIQYCIFFKVISWNVYSWATLISGGLFHYFNDMFIPLLVFCSFTSGVLAAFLLISGSLNLTLQIFSICHLCFIIVFFQCTKIFYEMRYSELFPLWRLRLTLSCGSYSKWVCRTPIL